MPQYTYTAFDQDGQVIRGEVSSENVSEAITELESRGVSVESISLVTPPASSGPGIGSDSLEAKLETVIARRDVLVPALTALASELTHSRSRREMQQLASNVRDAESVHVLRNDRVMRWLPLLVTGFGGDRESRQIGDLIAHAANESRKRNERRRILVYPLMVLALSIIVVTFLCVTIVPVFGKMFDEFGLRLPFLTRWIVGFSNEIEHHGLRFLIVTALAAIVLYVAVRLWTRYALTTRFFGTFVAGNSSSVSAMSSFTGQLAELLSIDVPMSDALWIAGRGCQHHYFQTTAEELARYAHESSAPLSESRAASRLPANLVYALEAGNGGGPNIALLRELAAIYSDRVRQRVDWSSGPLAQFAILVIGIVVGLIVIAMFAPLVSLVSGLS